MFRKSKKSPYHRKKAPNLVATAICTGKPRKIHSGTVNIALPPVPAPTNVTMPVTIKIITAFITENSNTITPSLLLKNLFDL